ncbi:hypothetical protein TIFTF001_039508 [Ficus carica]|uniref:Retrotransposon gag domain-containing protein n=1 Tax=Ficus carica TaxID=3494 RepID=A0AA88JF63_FICCA|nr:hypothetical protein TIFTF001_039484 [Ficus carica]GMN70449.1 hypothetical protein TIFTF001_039492 [Ficus carica]GMN70462.1 hypothetical protein TIFTF001_039500 [Ficus carica]GMN70465.1 hypothetical protein TIFTF001_039508 [Ficus carica]
MVRPRAAAARRPQEANLAEMVVNLQRRLENQEREMQNLREQLALQNQELLPPPAVLAQPAAPAVPATQAAQPVVLQESLYERFRYGYAMKAQQNEFNNIKQGSMSITKVVRKFDQLARLCPHLVPIEDERVRQMLDMFCPEIAVVIDSGERSPTTVAECVERALRDEYRLAKAKQERAKFFEEKKKEKSQSKQNQGNQPNIQRNRSNLNGNHPNQNHNKRKGNFNRNNNQKNQP